MPRPPRHNFLFVFLLVAQCTSPFIYPHQYISLFLSLASLLKPSFCSFHLFSHLLSSPLMSSFMLTLMFLFGIQAWTFPWQCRSRLALLPDLQSHQGKMQSWKFWIYNDMSTVRFRRENLIFNIYVWMYCMYNIWSTESTPGQLNPSYFIVKWLQNKQSQV